jgi:hypothetical protein
MTTDDPVMRPVASNRRFTRADTTTPLVGKVPLETPPDPSTAQPTEAKPKKPLIVLATTIIYRGRQITIQTDGMTLETFCDLLDARFGVVE